MTSAPVSAFVHLAVHTEYSLVDGLIRIKPLMQALRDAGMPAVAITEQGNLFSLVKFYRAAVAAGIKPVVGAELRLQGEQEAERPGRFTLLCQDIEGYRRLARLVSRSYMEGQIQGIPTVRRSWLRDGTDGLIALAGGASGEIGRILLNGKRRDARERLAEWRSLFPDRFYLDVARTGAEGEEEHVYRTVDIAQECAVPVVAVNDVRFISREDYEAHEARVCIHEGRTLADPRRSRRYTPQQYLRPAGEMVELFADLPEAIENSVEIARRCNLELSLDRDVLPEFPVPEGRSLDEWFNMQSRQGLERRLEGVLGPGGGDAGERRRPYEERLRHELEVISGMGFPGYFLIVADFIRWARENGIPVGPGRGSGAGSLVAYALGITDLDPIEYDLLFERFLNPERVSMPDFDIDFCMEGRDRVIEYVADRYGHDRVAQIITFGTMAAKAVVRDVGRVLGHPYGFVDQIAKLIPFELGMTLDKALAQEDGLARRYEEEEEVRTLIDLARSLEGLARNAGRHAGGVVIAPSSLTNFTPLYREHGGSGTVTQLDKDDVAGVGLVKFDFLGLRTLTVIDWALRTVNRQREVEGAPPVDIAQLPTADESTFRLIRSGATTAVFQLESRGMRELIRRLQPDTFEDIIALVALFRPGPLQSGMVEDFIERKHGRAPVAYPHPDVEAILKPTYGVILYQEQVMQIARVLAGYTLGEADLLRRAMGKKKPDEMAKQRAVFLNGSARREVEPATASSIFDLMEKFAGYGFNRSHSAAYAMIAYQTAWLKAHHPAAFMAAALSADMDRTDKIVVLIEECREMALTVSPPDVNRCGFEFTVDESGAIRYGLGAIKGIGRSAIECIIDAREDRGSYEDLYDFCRRVDPRRVNRRALEALVRAGALDELGSTRAWTMRALTGALQAGEQYVRNRTAGQNDMFTSAAATPETPVVTVDGGEWSDEERLQGEKETLGLYLSGHPFTRFEDELSGITTARLSQCKQGREGRQIVAGLVVQMRTMNSRRGRMAAATLDDRTGRLEVVVYSDVFNRCRGLLAKDRLLVAEGEIVADDVSGGYTMVVAELYDLEGARESFAKGLRIALDRDQGPQCLVDTLAEALEPYRAGRIPVWIDYTRADAKVRLALGRDWAVRPSEDLIVRLRELPGTAGVTLEY